MKAVFKSWTPDLLWASLTLQSGKIPEKSHAAVEGHWGHLALTLTPVHLQKLLLLAAAALWRVEAADRRLPRAPLALSAAAQQEMPRLRAYQWALSSGTHQPCPGQVNKTWFTPPVRPKCAFSKLQTQHPVSLWYAKCMCTCIVLLEASS